MGLALLTLKILSPASVTPDIMNLEPTDADATDLQCGEILQRRRFQF